MQKRANKHVHLWRYQFIITSSGISKKNDTVHTVQCHLYVVNPAVVTNGTTVVFYFKIYFSIFMLYDRVR